MDSPESRGKDQPKNKRVIHGKLELLKWIILVVFLFSFIFFLSNLHSGMAGAGMQGFDLNPNRPWSIELSGGDHLFFKLGDNENFYRNDTLPINPEVQYVIYSNGDIVLEGTFTGYEKAVNYDLPWYSGSQIVIFENNGTERMWIEARLNNTGYKDMTMTIGSILMIVSILLIVVYFLLRSRIKKDRS